MIAGYIIIGALAALMLAGTVNAAARGGEKEGICDYRRQDERRPD